MTEVSLLAEPRPYPLTVTLTASEVTTIRLCLRRKRRRVERLMGELARTGNARMRPLLGTMLTRLERLDARLATREVSRG